VLADIATLGFAILLVTAANVVHLKFFHRMRPSKHRVDGRGRFC
jgi:hypothetical protein